MAPPMMGMELPQQKLASLVRKLDLLTGDKPVTIKLSDDQKKKIKDNAYAYWLNQQKKAHDVLRLIPGLEFE